MYHCTTLVFSAGLCFVVAGAQMLKSYHEKAYSPLSLPDCDTFFKLVIQTQSAGGSIEDGVGAALSVLHHMKQTSLPPPAASTFTLATQCVLAQLEDGAPSHEVLMQLQQDVWQHMHTAGADSDVTPAYLAALDVFEGTQGVQTALLMQQNGLSGLSTEACLALVCVMEEYHLTWLHETFGAAFVNELELLANSSFQDTSQPESALLKFPDHPLPKLCVVQLNDRPAYLGVDDDETPWWMVPMTAAWQHGQSTEASVQQSQSSSEQGAEVSAAEQLVAEFGHLEKRNKSKRKG